MTEFNYRQSESKLARRLPWLLAAASCATTTRLTSEPASVVTAQVLEADDVDRGPIESYRVGRTTVHVRVPNGQSLGKALVGDLRDGLERVRLSFAREGYQTKTVEVPAGKAPEEIRVELDAVTSHEVRASSVAVDAGGQVVPKEIRSIGFEQVIEREGVTPQQILAGSEGAFVADLDVDPKGKLVLYSFQQTVETETGKSTTANVRMIDLDEGGLKHLTQGLHLNLSPTFTPDGAAVVFSSNRGGPYLNLYTIPLDRAPAFTLLTHRDGNDTSPSVSRDLVVFESKPAGIREPQLWKLDRDGFPTQLREGREPALSPDGKRIAFVGVDGKLWLMSTGGHSLTQLTTDAGAVESDPVWSPDGAWIVYVSNAGKDDFGRQNNDIWALDVRTMQSTQITTNGSDDRSPAFGEGGRSVYFTSNRGYKWGIWRLPFELESKAVSGIREPFDAPIVPAAVDEASAQATLRVRSTPPGARVAYLDPSGGRRILGRTPLATTVPKGRGTVMVVKPGHWTRVKKVDTRRSDVTIVKFKLGRRSRRLAKSG